jgi:uncharacterized membrane-anchored protein
MKLRPALAAALLLPLIGFGASWAMTHQKAQQGTDWDVPIAGYDPRDLLRGHYIQYRYEWPGITADENGNWHWFQTLCVEGNAPTITRVSRLENEAEAKCDAIVRAPRDGMTDLITGRFYVPQTRAREYEDRLRDSKLRGILRVRIREDGVMTPKSLRFRPLTAAEIRARQERETERPPAPLIMNR